MNSLSERVNSINRLVAQFKFLEGLDTFQADEIVSGENECPPTIGLGASRVSARISQPYLESFRDLGDRTQFSVLRWMQGRLRMNDGIIISDYPTPI